MAKNKKEPVENRGGFREGSGRKPVGDQPKKMISKKIDIRLVEYLRSCENGTKVIEDALFRSKGFREWNSNQ